MNDASPKPGSFTDAEKAALFEQYQDRRRAVCFRCGSVVKTRPDGRVGWAKSRWFECPTCRLSGTHMVPNPTPEEREGNG